MTDYLHVSLESVIEIIGGGTPRTSTPEYWSGDIPWLSVVDFNSDNKFVYDAEKKITQQGLDNSSTKILQEGDIIISARGTVGALAVLKKPMAFNQSCYGIRGREGKADTNYIYYVLKNAVDDFKQVSHGGVFDTITRDTFKEINITLPPLEKQKSIASILSSLDDKIDLLHRQNKTLEAMAETLFRQWFVEKESEYVPLGEVVETTSGGTPSRSRSEYFINGKYSWVKSKELNRSFIFNTEETITVEALNSSAAKLLPANSILIAMYGATVGEYAIIAEEMACNQAVCALKSNNKYPFTFLFEYFKQNQENIINMAVGSAQQNISQEVIKKLPLEKDIFKIGKFHTAVLPLYDKIKFNIYQLSVVKDLRDLLLPQLVNYGLP